MRNVNSFTYPRINSKKININFEKFDFDRARLSTRYRKKTRRNISTLASGNDGDDARECAIAFQS